jgi:DNA-binding HxlR family transcriptional regulator
MPERYGCPVQATIDLVAGKWKVQIIWHLSHGALRFAQLRNKLGSVSEKVLTAQLRELEAGGVVSREASDSVPPAVTYSLNDAGMKLVELMYGLCDWGSEHFQIAPTMPRREKALVQ